MEIRMNPRENTKKSRWVVASSKSINFFFKFNEQDKDLKKKKYLPYDETLCSV